MKKLGLILLSGIAVSFSAIAQNNTAPPVMPMPHAKMSPEQMDCMKKAMGNNVHPSTKQMNDAFKTCVVPPSGAPPPPAANSSKGSGH